MKIGFGSADWSDSVFDENGHPVMGGSGWARLGQYVNLIPHTVVIGTLCHKGTTFGVRGWDGKFHLDCDIIVMQRNMFGDIVEKMFPARASGQIILQDVDDWYWGLSHHNRAYYYSDPKVNPTENRVHYKEILKRSSGIICSTPFLAEQFSAWTKERVVVVTNHIELNKFTPRQHTDTDVPAVGWVGSTAHRSGDLELMRNVLPILYRNNEIKVHHSGHLDGFPLYADKVGLKHDQVSTQGMAAPAEYQTLLTAFDIGIVPLNDIPFNEAKSYIKGLEYAASGIPFVASPSQAYQQLHDDYGIGRLARKPKNWIAAIRELRNPETRAAEAKANLEKMAPFSHIEGAKKLTECLESFA